MRRLMPMKNLANCSTFINWVEKYDCTFPLSLSLPLETLALGQKKIRFYRLIESLLPSFGLRVAIVSALFLTANFSNWLSWHGSSVCFGYLNINEIVDKWHTHSHTEIYTHFARLTCLSIGFPLSVYKVVR